VVATTSLRAMVLSQSDEDIPLIEAKKILSEHICEVVEKFPSFETVKKFTWLPGWMIKMDTSRIEGAKKIADAIKNRNSNLLCVPYKEPYIINNFMMQKYPLIPEALVLVKEIKGTHDGIINLEQAKQLDGLIEDTYYYDLHSSNLIHTKDGKIAIIDTESKSFAPKYPKFSYIALLGSNEFKADAEEYIENKLRDNLRQLDS
jgi:hypothetical protein